MAAKTECFRAKMNKNDVAFVKKAKQMSMYPVMSRTDIKSVATAAGVSIPYWLTNSPKNRVGPALYFTPDEGGFIDMDAFANAQNKHQSSGAAHTTLMFEATPEELGRVRQSEFVPVVDPSYVGFGRNYLKIERFVTDGKFCPVFITGLSGNGKTSMVEQICARNNREYVRCNITELTDADDIIGGFRLVNGNTEFHKGPVTIAAERGAVLLLDEIDLGTQKIMCLQPVLEGKPFFIQKTNTWVYPKPGFTIIATANTKGLGDERGVFTGTNFLNEAMLDRFWFMYEQEYPTEDIESRILSLVFNRNSVTPDESIIKALTAWAADNRKTYLEHQGIDKVITTRRLVTIVEHYLKFDDIMDAVKDAVARFDDASKVALIQLFDKYIPKPDIPDIGASTKAKSDWKVIDGNIKYSETAHLRDILIANGMTEKQVESIPTDPWF